MATTKQLPRTGTDANTILSTMRSLRDRDVRWEEGRVFSLVFHAGEELAAFTREAYATYFSENGLNPSAFPSLRRMENEVVAMTADLLGGDSETAGNMTSGGTESILMAVKAARQWGRKRHPKAQGFEVLMPTSAHPAFDKACYYFGLSPVRVPVGQDFRADLRAMRKALSKRTVLVVGSAPQYPQGVVDPIEKLADLAASKGILMHVDACVGGFMLPFVRALGRDVPPFDFSVEGVTSMSVDLHKYAYAAKGASVVLYRNRELRKLQYFATTDWPGGIYASPTMLGSRPGGSIAAAWAVFHRLGHAGYVDIARQVMDTTDHMIDGINNIDGLQVLGRPAMSVFAIASDDRDIYEVADVMTARGWHLDRQQSPACLHVTVNYAHIGSFDEFLADLSDAAAECEQAEGKRLLRRAGSFAVRSAFKVLPRRVASGVMDAATSLLGVGDGGSNLPQRSAPMYGMMATLPNRGDIKKIVIDVLDGLTTPDADTDAILPEQTSANEYKGGDDSGGGRDGDRDEEP